MMNREQWLTELALLLQGFYRPRGLIVKDYRLTCGWPCVNALGMRRRRIGECHSQQSSKSGVSEIFISPTLDQPLQVAGVVAHELVHAAVGTKHGHKRPFVEACRKVGLTQGKPTEASPGPRLIPTVERFLEQLGPYPHQALTPEGKLKKCSTSIKLVCVCGCNFRISQKWLDEAGVPTCGCGAEMEVV